MDNRFDDLLHTVIVQKGQGLYGFFDVLFSFLYRKTDYYYEMAPGENMGFFPGQAEALIYNYFRKYQSLHFKERVPKREIDPKEVEQYIKNQRESKTSDEKKSPSASVPSSTSTTNQSNSTNETTQRINSTSQPTSSTVSSQVTVSANTTNQSTVSSQPTSQRKEEANLPISTYNGDSCDDYNWQQGVRDVTIQINLPENTHKRNLHVDLNNNGIKVIVTNREGVFFQGEFCEKVNSEDSNWTIDNNTLILYLEKLQERIWKSAFVGHKEIDTKKVDNSKRIDEFDTETQAALNKIVYEQNRKKNGLPTTEEEKKLQQLREAWDKPDSPFRGQPFDPSQFNLNEPMYYNTPDYEAKLRYQQEKKLEAEKEKEKAKKIETQK